MAILSLDMITPDVEARFWAKVDRRDPDECWAWKGKPSSRGYGRLQTPYSRSTPAHRISLVLHGGAVAEGEVVDHICRNKMCVNPHHLRSVTHKVNSLENSVSPAALNSKKTHCKRGHQFTPENIRMVKTGRSCRACEKAYFVEYYQAKKRRHGSSNKTY